MAKLTPNIQAVYKLLLPLCERKKITLNLDFDDPSTSVPESPTYLKTTLFYATQDAIKRCLVGDQITIGAKHNANQTSIFIQDSGSSLSKAEKALISTPNTKVHSRYGYGTSVEITL